MSGLTEQDFPGLIPLPSLPGSTNFVYGGTPSDPSVVRCIRDLKSRGFKVVFYPFLLGTSAGFPWRGRITSPGDLTQTATNDVATFMGSAAVGDFIRDSINLTVDYSGAPVRLDVPPHDPALCEPLHRRRRRESLRDWLGASRPRDPARSGLDEAGHASTVRATRSGTIRWSRS